MAAAWAPILLAASAAAAHAVVRDEDDAGGPAPDLRSKSLILVKVYCLVLVFAGTFAGGVSPYFLKWNEGFLVLGTQFAGGVFLGTAMMHFLSDANETFGQLTDRDYPFAFMLACAGYLLTMLADSAIAHLVSSTADAHGNKVVNMATSSQGSDPGHGVPSLVLQPGNVERGISNDDEAQSHELKVEGMHDTHGQPLKIVLNSSSLGDSILLIVALCFHSVFEGIAIGVAEKKAEAWKALWTVCLHKIFAAIAMGIALLRMLPERPLLSCIAYAFAFAISSPVGIAIGIIIDATTQGRVADWIFAISMGLAAGVFIFVSINHMFSKGYKAQKPTKIDTPLCRWLAVVAGVGVIAVVMIWD